MSLSGRERVDPGLKSTVEPMLEPVFTDWEKYHIGVSDTTTHQPTFCGFEFSHTLAGTYRIPASQLSQGVLHRSLSLNTFKSKLGLLFFLGVVVVEKEVQGDRVHFSWWPWGYGVPRWNLG